MSSSLAQQYHSITFKYTVTGNTELSVNTWDTYKLIPSSRPVIPAPGVNYKYVDVPGRDGSIDFSNYLVGRPTYSDRSGNISFYVTEPNSALWSGNTEWFTRRAALAQMFDGQKTMKMILDDDPSYYYKGRFYLKDWQSGEHATMATIEYRISPYKYAVSNNQAVIG